MRAQSGFSLVELSIVLVILGLLVGGVLSGQALIRAAELRSVTEDINKYQGAIYTFRDKYFALPGDMRNATTFWGEAASGSDCATTVGNGTETCNGDGDSRISVPASSNERYRFWQHLAIAGLIEGNYTGVAGPNNLQHSIIGTNVPMARASNAGFTINATGSVSSVNVYAGNYGHTFVIGRATATGGIDQPFLKPEEMWNLDSKLDDGRPAHGRVRPYKPAYSPNCATDATSSTAYALSESGLNCLMIVMTGV